MIEDNWRDGIIYYVEFTTKTNKKVTKALVLDVEFSLEDVAKIISEKFQNIVSINHIDFWDDCLSLRDNIQL